MFWPVRDFSVGVVGDGNRYRSIAVDAIAPLWYLSIVLR